MTVGSDNLRKWKCLFMTKAMSFPVRDTNHINRSVDVYTLKSHYFKNKVTNVYIL